MVKTLVSLKPTVAATGHGVPMTGETLTENLTHLADKFAKPDYGKYLN